MSIKAVITFITVFFMGVLAHGNLLDNPGFEGSVSGNPADDESNWYTWEELSTHVSTWQQRSGGQALLIEGTWDDTPAEGGFEQKVDVVAGDEYGLNFYYYWDGNFTSQLHDVVIDWRNGSGSALDSLRYEMDMGDPDVGWKYGGWHKFTAFALKAPAGAVQAEIRFEFEGIGDAGAFYLDDVDFSDAVAVSFEDSFPVMGARDYAFSFGYLWSNALSATASQLELIWLGVEGELGTKKFSINQMGNADLLHSAGFYFLSAPSGATSLQARVLSFNLSAAAHLRISNAVLNEVEHDVRELRNNSFELSCDGDRYGNWMITGGWERVVSVACHGDHAMRMDGGTMGSNELCQVIQVIPDTVYELALQHYVFSDQVVCTNRAQVRWFAVDGSSVGSEEHLFEQPSVTGEWERVLWSGITAPPNAVTAVVAIAGTSVGPAGAYHYVDDVFFREPAPFFRRSTTNILDLAGNPFMIRGLALSGWFFPEAYMFGIEQGNGGHINSYTQMRRRFEEILGSEERSEAFWDVYTTNFLTEADVALVASKGVNTVRLPFNFRELSPENNEGAYRMKGFEQLDRVIQWCKNQGVYVILDMHSCPGGNAPVNSGDPEYVYYNSDWGKEAMKACLWRFDDDYNDMTGRTPESNVERTAAIWRFIAERYRNENQILGFELINEPFLDGSDDQTGPTYHNNSQNFEGLVIRDTFMKVSDAVREVNDRHLFFVEGDMFAEWCDNLMPVWDDNMAVAFHRYWKTNSVDCLDEYIELRDTEQVPLWLSESGENSNPWCRELWQMLEEHNIGYTWWTWKRMGGTYGGFIGELPASFEYCIDNLWEPTVDVDLFEAGLLDTAAALRTENCVEQYSYFGALLADWFSTETRPFRSLSIPGLIYGVDYDHGDWSNAYYDTAYKNDSFWNPTAYNEGRVYRNDGVDIFASAEGNGYVVDSIADGEWMKYTVALPFPGTYDIDLRYVAAGVVRNGSFEDEFDHWGNWGSSAVTNLNASKGSWAACMLNRASAEDDSYAGFSQRRSVEGGKSYRLSFDYYMGPSYTAGKRNVTIEWFDENDTAVGGKQVFSVGQIGQPAMWRSFGPQIMTAPSGACRMELMFDFASIGLNGGNFYVDDVVFNLSGDARQIRFFLNDSVALTDVVTLPAAAEWTNAAVTNVAIPYSGIHTLKVEFVRGGFALSSMDVAFQDVGFVDGDADGMDDRWELSHGGNLDASADADQDALTTLQEFYADTDPTNSASLLSSLISTEGNALTVGVAQTSAARVYSVDFKEELSDAQWTSLVTNVAGSGGGMMLVETNGVGGFFRVKAETP